MYAVVPFTPPSSSGPDIAIDIATNAVGIARRHIYKKATIGQSNAIDYVIHVNRMWIGGMLWDPGVHDVELFLVRGKTDTVGLVQIADNYTHFTCFRVEAVGIVRQLKGSFVAFVIRHDAVTRIGKPDRPVGMHGQVIRSVKHFSLKLVHQHRDRAV